MLYDGFAYRKGTADEATPGYVRRDYRHLPIEQGDLVLDLGAHIGYFTAYALNRGAAFVLAVEPDPENTKLWRMNIQEMNRASLIEAAVADHDRGADLFATRNARGTDASSLIVKGRNKIKVSVPTVTMDYLFSHMRATVVKIDIEGGEYALDNFWAAVPFSVRALSAEMHFGRKGWREKAMGYAAGLEKQGFACVRAANWGEKMWNTIFTYVR